MIKFHTAEKRKLLLGNADTGFYHRHVLLEDSGLAEKMDEGTLPIESVLVYRALFESVPAADHPILLALLDSTECPQSDILVRDAEIADALDISPFRVAALRFILYRRYGRTPPPFLHHQQA